MNIVSAEYSFAHIISWKYLINSLIKYFGMKAHSEAQYLKNKQNHLLRFVNT